MRTDQSGWVEEVGDTLNLQSPHAGSDPAAVLQLAHREFLTLQQVKLNVPCRQSLEKKRQAVLHMGSYCHFIVPTQEASPCCSGVLS